MKRKITLNWKGENHVFWNDCKDDLRATFSAMHRLAGKLQITFYSVRQYYQSKFNNITVEKGE